MTVSTPRSAQRPFRASARRRDAWRVRPLVWALAVIGTSAVAQVPTGFHATYGTVDAPTSIGGAMSIRQRSDRAIVEWGSFSIGKENSVTFNQPGAASILLNRVLMGGGPSEIAGKLTANGRIFLINPSGVLFGGDSQVSTGGLIASTLDISDDDFKLDKFNFERADGTTASIINRGKLSAPGGTIALMAAQVTNEGTIVADGGTAALVSGRKVSLDFQGDGLTTFRIDSDAKASTALITNAEGATLQADGGRVAVIADSSQIAQQVVNQHGTVRARSLTMRNGEIVLDAGANEVLVDGKVDASSQDAGTKGGSVDIRGGRVRVAGAADIDASGDVGGGTATLKGIEAVTLGAEGTLRADARVSGRGGEITVESDGGLHVNGILSANAAGHGDGGKIRTAGTVVEVGGAQASASGVGGGANGKWSIESRADLAVVQGTPAPRPDSIVASNDPSVAAAGAIGKALDSGTDVTLASIGMPIDAIRGESGSIEFAADARVVKQAGGAATLQVDAMRNISMREGSGIESNNGALNVNFNADSSGEGLTRRFDVDTGFESGGAIDLNRATVLSNGGNINFYGQSDAAEGHAIGGVAYHGSPGYSTSTDTGVTIFGSTVSSCAGPACDAGAGTIRIAGNGITVHDTSANRWSAGSGVTITGSDILAAAGDITVRGNGGIGAAGVLMEGYYDDDFRYARAVSKGGNVTIIGTADASTQTDGLLTSDIRAGVDIIDSTIRAGQDVLIDGTGSDLSSMTQSETVQKELDGDEMAPAGGVRIIDSDIGAGAGRTVKVLGTAGSDGLLSTGEDPPYVADPATGVMIGTRSFAARLAAADEEGSPYGIAAAGGLVHIEGRDSDVRILGNGAGFEITTDGAMPGFIEVMGRNIALDRATTLSSQGESGGSVRVEATSIVAVDDAVQILASATGADGKGGAIVVKGEGGARVYGTLAARGAGSGDGGSIETSGGAFDLSGITVDASAGGTGTDGTWLIDPYNVRIVNGAATGSLGADNDFEAMATSILQDQDINDALNANTNVSIGTGTGGLPTDGSIVFDPGVNILRTTGADALTLTFNAHTAIDGSQFTIAAADGTGPLNLVFNSNANDAQPGTGSISFVQADLRTQGGSVLLAGQGNAATGVASSSAGDAIRVTDSGIDTRVGGVDTGAGGAVTMRGAGIGQDSIYMENTVIQTATGDVTLQGVSPSGGGSGVTMRGSDSSGLPGTGIATTSGNVSILGIGSGDISFGGSGVEMEGVNITTVGGNVDVRGLASGSGTSETGVSLEGASLVTSTGRIRVAGESQGDGLGIDLQGGSAGSPYAIDGGSTQPVILLADNNGTADAIELNATVRSATLIDLRPGGVDATGNATNHAATAIALGGPGSNGFSLSDTDLSNLDAPDIVVGSNSHAGNIVVEGAVDVDSNLTLQNEGGGAIAVNAGVSAAKLALLAGSGISQSGTAGIAAASLLARTAAGNVILVNPANSVATVAGAAAGDFRYVNAGALSIGNAQGLGVDATADTPQSVSVDGIAGDRAIVQALAGNLSVDRTVTTITAATLQADGGAIALNQGLNSGTVALQANGAVTQAAGAGVVADSLRAASATDSVTLADPANQVGVLAGSAAGDFTYANDGDLSIGNVTAASHTAAGALQTTTVSGITADTTLVQARSGNLAVDAATSGATTLGLQADNGSLAVNAGLQGNTIALVANGDVTQTGAAGIAANQLLARSATGNVELGSVANNVDVVAGSAAQRLRYTDANGVSIGNVNATTLNAAGAPAGTTADGIGGNAAIVQALAGDVSLDAAAAVTDSLTLQADTGNVALNRAVETQTLALFAGGDITQFGTSPINAANLLARSSSGNVALDNAANNVDIVTAQAAGTLAYTDADALTIGSVTADRIGTAGIESITQSGASASASTLRTLTGDLTLDGPIGGGTADLVAAGRFQNPDAATISTSGPWRIWADTWEGETRGALAGSGPLPNLYNRSFGATVGDADNHFIYRQQPVATVTLDSAGRPAGLPNPPLGYTVDGLILGDTGAGFTGVVGTSATADSPPGTYAVTATTPFVSAEGYAINIVPGRLLVNDFSIPTVDIQRELPTTYLYDRNIAPVAMCFATGPLAGDKSEQVGDVLSREWARVRTRPNLTNCVSTDRTNACSNF